MSNRTESAVLACVFTLFIGSGCADSEAVSAGFETHDSAGVTIARSTRPLWTDQDSWRIGAEPSRIVGGEGLLGIAGAAFLGNGKLVVASADLNEVRLFDDGDTTGRLIGRSGEGPGEFARLSGLHTCAGDTLVVNDFNRLHVFTPDGSFVRTMPVPQQRGDGMLRIAGVSPSCDDVFVRLGSFVVPARGTVTRMPVSLAWISAGGARDTLVSNAAGWEVTSSNGTDAPFIPWGRDTHWATNDGVVVVGSSDAPEFMVYRDNGLSTIVRWTEELEPVGPEDRRRYEQIRESFVAEFPQIGSFLLELSEYPRIPDHRPTFLGMIVDMDGNYWLRRYPHFVAGRPDVFDFGKAGFSRVPEGWPQSETWTVFDTAGQWLGDVQMPVRFALKAVGSEALLGVAFDSLDAERVVVYRLIKATEVPEDAG